MSDVRHPVSPTRLPHKMSPLQEARHLLHQRRLIDRRLAELAALIDPDWSHPPEAGPITLSRSGLRLVASRPGEVLFKGGRDHG